MDRIKAIAEMKTAFEKENSQKEIIPGKDFIPHAAKVVDSTEISYLSESVLDAWFTTGRFAENFELALKKFYSLRSASLVNSGSSANLVALSALTSPTLQNRAIK